MQIKNYQEQAKRTCPTLGSEQMDLAHMVLGIHSEFNEYIDGIVNENQVNIGEEIADMWWYLANYCTFRGYSLDELSNEKEPNDYQLVYWTSKLQDIVKKYVAYGKVIDVEKEKTILRSLLFSMIDCISDSDIILEDILETNIAKLRVRYPEKFTTELAINRDLENENKALTNQIN